MVNPEQITEFENANQEYEKRFNTDFPIPLSGEYDDYTEFIDIINRCLKENKNVYELGIYKDPFNK